MAARATGSTAGVLDMARATASELVSGILMGAPRTEEAELKTKVARRRVEAEEIIVERTVKI
jgi:hypothetical protein